MKILQNAKCWLDAGHPAVSPSDDFGGNRGTPVQDT